MSEKFEEAKTCIKRLKELCKDPTICANVAELLWDCDDPDNYVSEGDFAELLYPYDISEECESVNEVNCGLTIGKVFVHTKVVGEVMVMTFHRTYEEAMRHE